MRLVVNLSVRVKSAEDAVAAAQKEAHEKVVARREQAHAAATAAIEKMDQDLRSAGNDITSNWNALKAKVAADMKVGMGRLANSSMIEASNAPRTMPRGLSGRHHSRSTMPSRRSRRLSRPFSMLSLAASKRKRPADPKAPPNFTRAACMNLARSSSTISDVATLLTRATQNFSNLVRASGAVFDKGNAAVGPGSISSV